MSDQETVMLVDDEPSLLRLTKRTLENQGYRVLTASGAAEALGLAEEHGESISLLLTDVVMPHLDGAGMVRALQKLNPAVKILATSGHAESQGRIEAIAEFAVPFILKPYTTETLLSTMRDLLSEVTVNAD